MPDPTTDRLERLRAAMRTRGVDALLVGPSADLRYLVGYHALPLERLTMLVVPVDGPASLIVPELETARAEASGATHHADLVTWGETDDPVAHVVDRLAAAGTDLGGTFGVQDRLWTSFTLGLQAALGGARWVPGSSVMRDLRIVKTAAEIQALRDVGAAIDAVHAAVPDLLRPGRTEAEVGRDIAERILDDHDEVNFVIVASGPNGASPHHETGDRTLEVGDAVVVDIGGTRAGYCSDSTRDYALGHLPDGYADLHRALEEAQEAAVQAVRPGVSAEAIDAAARDHLDTAGYGRYFVHRTGHGIGVEEHEEPWIVAGNADPVATGMAFSIEPGIYVPDRYGSRIEDIVVVTEDGVERVNHRPREVLVV
ncbi:M24 family metallopeptidase [Nitriliruptor alkaliphilus]|uniref:M24 family metallopeptidase n=1 Tax=Nitriliruptor alkaliphilus TaxID=427918 RepID=UPI001B80DECF|nr:Xaa-Pro peptidase family protein [Nitriliruptor alkaliphilus]